MSEILCFPVGGCISRTKKTSFHPLLQYSSEEEGGIERQTEVKAEMEKMGFKGFRVQEQTGVSVFRIIHSLSALRKSCSMSPSSPPHKGV